MKQLKRIFTGLTSALCAIAIMPFASAIVASAEIVYHPEDPPTCTSNGNIEYWYDTVTRKYYADAGCSRELTANTNDDEVHLRALGHDFVPTWNWEVTTEEHNGETYYTGHSVSVTLNCSRCDESVELYEYDYNYNRTDNSIRVTSVYDPPSAGHIGWTGYEATATYTYGSRTFTFTDRYGHDVINGIHYEGEHYKDGEDFVASYEYSSYEDGEHYDEYDNSHYYLYSYDLQARVAEWTNTSTAGSADTVKNDSQYHIWNVTIDADTLRWDLVRNVDTQNYQTLTWDPVEHVYTAGTGDVQSETVSYSIDPGDTATKTISITNDSNFPIRRSVSATNNKFTVTETDTAIAIGGSADSGITIDPTKFSGIEDYSYTSVGTAVIYLTADGSIQSYTGP